MATEPKRTYLVEDMEPGDSYKLSTGLTVPRPIGWIGTVDADGKRNLAPYSFFNHCLLYTSPSPRDLSTSRMPSSA